MHHHSRRAFLSDVGRGMLVAGVGPALAQDLGLAPSAAAEDAEDRLTFGPMERLASIMRDVPAERLLPRLVQELESGTPLADLVRAGALANARAFGGQDYTGYHTLMAIPPALNMAHELPDRERALPVLKVLYRNTSHMQSTGANKKETLCHLEAAEVPSADIDGEALRALARAQDMDGAERSFAALMNRGAQDAFNALQYLIQDDINVHRVVLAYRSWALLDLTGPEHAHTLLRQSVRFCVDEERSRVANGRPEPGIRKALPKLLDQHRLLSRKPGDRLVDDQWVDRMAALIATSGRDQAADAVAAALAEGIAPAAIAEAMALAANWLVLCDPGRREGTPDRPKGSVHGASVGVHASDAANAWRHIATVTDPRNAIASLIVGAYHTAGQGRQVNPEPFHRPEHLAAIDAKDGPGLLREADDAIRHNDQFRACAAVQRYGELGADPRPVFDLMLRYATSEDGALHAEKYYRTVSEEFALARPAFRWRHLVALARVSASEYGRPAPGIAEARRLLDV